MAKTKRQNRTYAARRYNRYIKGARRIRADRAQHGNDRRCECFQAGDGRGRIFARFADHPKHSSCLCCSNPRRLNGASLDELRAPTVSEWS